MLAKFRKAFPDFRADTDFYVTVAFSFKGKVDTVRTETGVTPEIVATGGRTHLVQSIKQLRESKTRLIFLNQIGGAAWKYDSYSDCTCN